MSADPEPIINWKTFLRLKPFFVGKWIIWRRILLALAFFTCLGEAIQHRPFQMVEEGADALGHRQIIVFKSNGIIELCKTDEFSPYFSKLSCSSAGSF
jgi:hypothetical protein